MRSPQNLLVTGGCGFIGSAFIRNILQKAEFEGLVVNLDAMTYAANPASVVKWVPTERHVLVEGDIGDVDLVTSLIDRYRIDTLVHFAAESHVDRSIMGPEAFIKTNVLGTMRLLEAVRQRPQVHFHHVSTDEVFGSLGPTGRFTETTPYAPQSPYAASKAASDHLVRAWGNTFGLSVTVSNTSNNYGPFQFPEKLIPLMVLNMLDGAPLPVYGDGQNVRDWLYVDDHIEALWTILRKADSGSTYNVGGNCERTNLELLHALIETVSRLTGKTQGELESLITFVKDRPGHDRRYSIDSSRIARELGWRPTHQLEAGLEETVRFYLEHSDWVAQVKSGAYRDWLKLNYGESRLS